MSTLFNQYSQPSSTLISPIPNNPYFLCNILADNAREYIMLSNQPFFGLFDVIYAFILAVVLGFMVRSLNIIIFKIISTNIFYSCLESNNNNIFNICSDDNNMDLDKT